MARYAIIDTETTGLDPTKNQVLEVGIIICDDDLKIVDFDNFLVRHEEYTVSPKAMEINGIDLVKHNESADDANVACDKIIAFLEKNRVEGERYIFAGQNCSFDKVSACNSRGNLCPVISLPYVMLNPERPDIDKRRKV